MVRFYDNWERLVEAVMHREQFRQLSLCDSLSSGSNSLSRNSSFSTTSNTPYAVDSFSPTPSPLYPDAVRMNKKEQIRSRNIPAKRNPIWKGLWIFRGFSLKKDYGREDKVLKWSKARRTLHGLRSIETPDYLNTKQRDEEILMADIAKRRAETARLQALYTLKGRIESVLRAKGIDLDSVPHHYTI